MFLYNIFHNSSSKILHPHQGWKEERREGDKRKGREGRKERKKERRESVLPILLSSRFAVCVCESLMSNIGEGNGKPLQYSCLENPMDGGAWWATVHGVATSRSRLSDFTFTFHFHFSLSRNEEGNGNPLQCFCLENPRGGRAWWAAVYGVTQSRTWLKWLSSSSSSSNISELVKTAPPPLWNSPTPLYWSIVYL